MIDLGIPLYLASKSPRRKKLLRQIGLKFRTFSVDLDEEINDGETPASTVKRLALHKMSIADKKVRDALIITADTIVVLDKKIIGKPKNKMDAEKILQMLSGKTHKVYTGFSIKNQRTGKILTDYEKTEVTFRVLGKSEIKNYIDSGSPMDKAGAYGIQDDFGAVFISQIKGCYYNVVGLPLSKVYSSIQRMI